MSEGTQLVSNYREIRERLRFPRNAVPDSGIDLKRKRIPPEQPPEEVVDSCPQIFCRVFINEVPFVPVPKVGLSLMVIERAVCAYFGITRTTLYARRRTQLVVYPRHICWYLACKHTTLSMPQIGRTFSCDHTTILHARDKITALILMDPVTADIVAKLERVLFPDEANQPQAAVPGVSQPDVCEQRREGQESLPVPGVQGVDESSWVAAKPTETADN